MYYYQPGFGIIDFLSILLIAYFIYLGISHYLLKKKVEKQEKELYYLKRKFIQIRKQINKNSDDDEFEDFEFMNNSFD